MTTATTTLPEKITLKQWLGLIGISLLGFTLFLDVTIVSNALPAIQKALTASNTELQWLPNAIYVTFCALMAVMGRIGSIYGVRKIFYSAMLIFALATFACGFATSIHELIVFRFIQGICAATFSLTTALISHNFTKMQQAKVIGLFSSLAGSGLVIGPVLGGILVDWLSWRWIFFIMVPIIAAGLLLCLFSMHEHNDEMETEETKVTLDWVGGIFFILLIGSLVTTTVEGSNWGWHSHYVVLGFSIFIISLIGFSIAEFKVSHPIIPFNLLLNRTFLPCALTCGTCGACIGVLLFFDPIYLQVILGNSAAKSGFLLLCISLMYVLMSPIAGAITQHRGVHTGTWIVGLFLIAATFFHALLGTTENILLILAAFIPFGLAWGAVNIAPVVAVMHSTEPRHSGVVVGALWTIFNLGSAFCLAITLLIFHYVQKATLIHRLSTPVTKTNASTRHLIQQLITNPEHSRHILAQYPSALSEKMLFIFKLSFVYGFNTISWMLCLLALTAFLVAFFIMKK